MKLTADLINNSLSHINPLGDRELILRDLKIPAIENLGVTKDLNDTIDFTNNDLRVLGNFPRLNRLKCLLLNNNRITRIESGLETYVPHLHTIILTNNAVAELGDLEPLTKLKKLTHLSLLDNPLPQLRVLDFNKVKLAERNEAKKLFSTEQGTDNDLARSIGESKSKTFEPGEGLSNGTK